MSRATIAMAIAIEATAYSFVSVRATTFVVVVGITILFKSTNWEESPELRFGRNTCRLEITAL